MKITYQYLINKKEYSFLKENKYLNNRLLFLCVYGSHALGTNVESSDLDIRGVFLDDIAMLSRVDRFEQFEDENTDTVIYSLSKFIKLSMSCNPNIIDLYFLDDEDYLFISPLGKRLLDNRLLFLSKKAIFTFGGYANMQLNRLENALARNEDISSQKDTLEHINRTVSNVIMNWKQEHRGNYIVNNYVKDDEEILFDINATEMDFASIKNLSDQLHNVFRTYEKKTIGKNKRKDDAHLNKHMMHLIRLYFEINELLETNHYFKVKRNREELQILKDIRSGKYRDENGKIKKEFFDMLNQLDNKLNRLKETTTLPDECDKDAIDKLAVSLFEEGLKLNENKNS